MISVAREHTAALGIGNCDYVQSPSETLLDVVPEHSVDLVVAGRPSFPPPFLCTAFLRCLIRFLYPRIAPTPLDDLSFLGVSSQLKLRIGLTSPRCGPSWRKLCDQEGASRSGLVEIIHVPLSDVLSYLSA